MHRQLRNVALILSIATCGVVTVGSLGQQADSQTSAGATASATSPLVVKLLEAGTGDKKPLRYAFAKGQDATMTSTGTIEMKTSLGGQDMPAQKRPPMTSKMNAKVTEVAANGDATVDLTYTGPSAKAGTSGSVHVTSRGIASAFDLTIPADASAADKQQIEGTRQKSTQYFVPFPEEAVGVGAKWQVTQTITQQAMTIEQTTVYTLKSRTGDVAELDMALTQNAVEQDIESPQMPGMKIHLKSFKTTGSGTATVNVGTVMCTAAKMDASTDMAMTVPQMGDMSQHMTTSLTAATVITPAK